MSTNMIRTAELRPISNNKHINVADSSISTTSSSSYRIKARSANYQVKDSFKSKTAKRYTQKSKHGSTALPENNFHRNKPGSIIPKAPMRQLMREILEDVSPGCRFSIDASNKLQHITEEYLVGLFYSAKTGAMFDGRDTITGRDLQISGMLERTFVAEVLPSLEKDLQSGKI